MPAKSHLEIVVPTGENRAVLPQRRRNAEYRQREHLTPSEVAKLIETAKRNRYGQRDATMILVAYRHGLRASEICDLEWSADRFRAGRASRHRRKGGKPATHPIRGDELREPRKLARSPTGHSYSRPSAADPSLSRASIGLSQEIGQKANLPFQGACAYVATHAPRL